MPDIANQQSTRTGAALVMTPADAAGDFITGAVFNGQLLVIANAGGTPETVSITYDVDGVTQTRDYIIPAGETQFCIGGITSLYIDSQSRIPLTYSDHTNLSVAGLKVSN